MRKMRCNILIMNMFTRFSFDESNKTVTNNFVILKSLLKQRYKKKSKQKSFNLFLCLKNRWMKKRDYIKTAQNNANLRIWDFISFRYKSIARRNVFLGFLWMIAASIVFGFIAVIGWFSSFSMLFRDLRFTPHYLRTAIVSLRMTDEQTAAFLKASVLDYKRRLSYGNIAVEEQKRIESSFELLFLEFGISKKDNSENIEMLTQIVSESNNELKTISNYTSWKHTVEKEEIERKQQLQDEC